MAADVSPVVNARHYRPEGQIRHDHQQDATAKDSPQAPRNTGAMQETGHQHGPGNAEDGS